ncbi:splicing factor, CC1-like protein [Actinidia rufa]|uniref:Splicing factor, CC1-like protein n=1 Tax=Actinidia rufa TaxID=165716 RepID=A0A7J0EZW8_9ERIC|nr:splicing factor, CC1-like protein [Actinidia rufa]
MAIALSGHLLLGQPVMVKPSEAEKNLVQSNASDVGSAVGPHGAVDRKLYVGNLHFNMTEFQLKQHSPADSLLVDLPFKSELILYCLIFHSRAILGEVLVVVWNAGCKDLVAQGVEFELEVWWCMEAWAPEDAVMEEPEPMVLRVEMFNRATNSLLKADRNWICYKNGVLQGYNYLEAYEKLQFCSLILMGPLLPLPCTGLLVSSTVPPVKYIFEAFGSVELVQLPTDPETGHCKGFGFIQFVELDHAKAAQSLNGKLEIAGRIIKVGFYVYLGWMGGWGLEIKVSSVTDHVGVQDSGAKAADFDDDEGGGLSLNAQSRALLMQKLDRSGIATSIAGPLGVQTSNGTASSQQGITLPFNGQTAVPAPALPALVTSVATEPIGKPSECLLLKNMFDPATETDPEFDLDIRDDVQEECSNYGRVKHIYVDISMLTSKSDITKNSAGYVYLRFETVEAAAGAQRAMHSRWFARRLISAVFLQPYEYDAKFKGAA